MPPKQHYKIPFSDEAKESLQKIRKEIEEKFPHIWFQPNKIGVTPFPTTEEEFEEIAALLKKNKEKMKEIEIYRHVDSFDIVPAGIDKGKGISYLLQIMNLSAEKIIAVGDGVNDYSMFAMAGFSVGVNVSEDWRVDKNCKNTLEMLQFILEYINKEL